MSDEEKVEVKEIVGFSTVTRVNNITKETDEIKEEEHRITVKPFVTNTATVSVKGGATINLGNYESGRIDVMLSVPCYIEEVEEIYKPIKEWVDNKVYDEVKELREASK